MAFKQRSQGSSFKQMGSSKGVKKKATKKIAKKILKKVGSKFLGPVGAGLTAVDVLAIGGHTYKSYKKTKDIRKSIKKGVKKWWDDPGIIPKKP